MSIKELKKRTIGHPVSIIPSILVFIFGVCLIIFGIKPYQQHIRERLNRTEVTGVISEASDVREGKQLIYRKSTGLGSVYTYYQDFKVNYTYKGKKYSKYKKNFELEKSDYHNLPHKHYKDGDTLKVFVSPSDTEDIKLDRELWVETQGIKVISVFLIINILIIFIPKPLIWETEKSENNSES